MCKTLIKSKTVATDKVTVFHVSVIQSDFPSDNNPKLIFRHWRYAKFPIFIKNLDNLHEIYTDTSYNVSLIIIKLKKYQITKHVSRRNRNYESSWI